MYVTVHLGQRLAHHVLLVFSRHLTDLTNSVETGKRLGDLRADRSNLDQRRRH